MAVMNSRYPVDGSPLSIQELRRALGAQSALFHFLKHYASRDVVEIFDDFTQDTLDTNPWAAAAGATATTWAINVAENGVLRGVTGTTAATSGLQLYTPKILYGARNPGFEVRFKTSDITESRLEFGFVDGLPSVNTACVNSLSTPTFNTVADAALYLYNHTGTTTTSGLYVIDSTAVTGDAEKLATTTQRPVNDTWQRVRVQVIGGAALLWLDGVFMGVLQTALKSSVALQFAISEKNNSTTSQNVDIDYVRIWADRN